MSTGREPYGIIAIRNLYKILRFETTQIGQSQVQRVSRLLVAHSVKIVRIFLWPVLLSYLPSSHPAEPHQRLYGHNTDKEHIRQCRLNEITFL